MKKNFQIIITIVALIVLFFNHFELTHSCKEYKTVAVTDNSMIYKNQGVDLSAFDYSFPECVEYNKIPGLSQNSLRYYWDEQVFPDIFVVLIYVAILYFTKDLTFTKKKKEKKE